MVQLQDLEVALTDQQRAKQAIQGQHSESEQKVVALERDLHRAWLWGTAVSALG